MQIGFLFLSIVWFVSNVSMENWKKSGISNDWEFEENKDHQTKDIRKERRKLRDIDTSTRNLKLLVEKQIGIKKPMSKKNKETLKKTWFTFE